MKPLIIIALAVFLSPESDAQIFDKNDSKQLQNSSPLSTLNQQSIIKPVVQDGPIDPKEYIVGPGDVFTVSIWATMPLSFQIPVSPEGTIIIPSVSEVRVSGFSLGKAKELTLAEVRKKYISATVSFTLSQPRSFVVTVRGYVLNEDQVIVQATQRAESAIRMANDLQAYKLKSELILENRSELLTPEEKFSKASTRNITILRKDGIRVRADIEKYAVTGNSLYNPLLRDGDVIIVPPSNTDKQFIGVHGAVIKSGNYEYVEGDSLSQVVAIAGGVTQNADDEKVIISRTDGSGNRNDQVVNLRTIIEHASPDIPLLHGDRIVVSEKTMVDRGGVVRVEGELVSPGAYSLIQDSTKLSEIIRKAGGFTPYASLNGAYIIRQSPIVKQRDLNLLQLRKGYTTSEDTTYFTTEALLKIRNDIVSVDFVSLFGKNDLSKDVSLRDGDRIVVPSKTNAVYVFGEVRNPGFVHYVPGKSAEYYISAAGGETDRAEDGDIKIIKAGSKQWLSLGETVLEDGDYLWVPRLPYRTTGYYLGIYSQVFGIIGTVATLILLVSK